MIGPLGYIPSLPVIWHSSLDTVPSTLDDYPHIDNNNNLNKSTLNNPSSSPSSTSNQSIQQQQQHSVATFFICHELFDALPVHQLVWKGDNETGMWIERLVDNFPKQQGIDEKVLSAAASSSTSTSNTAEISSSALPTTSSSSTTTDTSDVPCFRMVLSTSPTPASIAYTAHERAMRESFASSSFSSSSTTSTASAAGAAVASSPLPPITAHERVTREGLVPTSTSSSSSTEASSTSTTSSSHPLLPLPSSPPPPSTLPPIYHHSEGDVAEYSPESVKLAYLLSLRIKQHSGAALIIDYGNNNNNNNNTLSSERGAWTLRGIYKHRFVNPLSSPGKIDLSCDVDFNSLSFAITGTGNDIIPLGPIKQGIFLQQMGIRERLISLLKACDHDGGDGDNGDDSIEVEKEKIRLINEAKRLVDPNEMGSLYKVLAIIPSSIKETIIGFES